MEFFEVIKTRKSVRGYKDKKVDEDKIKYVLECARLAPSWANKQCWSYGNHQKWMPSRSRPGPNA